MTVAPTKNGLRKVDLDAEADLAVIIDNLADDVDATITATKLTLAGIANTLAGVAARLAKMPVASASGQVSIPGFNGSPNMAAITFPAGRFTVAPKVMTSPNTLVVGQTVHGTAATDITTAGCNIWVFRDNDTNTIVQWYAVQDV